MNITYGTIEAGRALVIDHITAQREKNPQFKVIDIGGVAGGGWSNPYVDLIVDINAQDGPRAMSIDITRPEAWTKLLDHVAQHGLFDYAICNHTLEDVHNPFTTLELLPKIAQGGILSMPSANTELTRLDGDFLGYIHHRWIFDQDQGSIFVMPKLGYLESDLSVRRQLNPEIIEIRYQWQGSLPFKIFMDNYLGPTTSHVRDQLNTCLGRSLR